MAENNNNKNGQVTNGLENATGGAPQGAPEANGTEPEKKEGFFARKKREHDERREARRNMTHGEWCDAMKKKFLVGGAVAGITAIAIGVAYSKGQSDAIGIGETMALPDNAGDTDGFDATGEDATAFESDPDTTFVSEPSEV
jgi:hypothetical protein